MRARPHLVLLALAALVGGIFVTVTPLPATGTIQPGELWTWTYPGQEVSGVAIDADDNVLVASSSVATGSAFVRKIDPDGTQLWKREWAGPDFAWTSGHDVAVDADGAVYLVGSETVSAVQSKVFLRKYGAGGILKWTVHIKEAFGNAVAVSGTRVAVVGDKILDDGTTDALLRVYDRQGEEQWTRIFDGKGGDIDVARDVAFGADGSVYAVGSVTIDPVGPDEDMFVRRYEPDGTLVFKATHDGASDTAEVDIAQGVAVSDSTLYVCGVTDLSLAGGSDAQAFLRTSGLDLAPGWTQWWGGMAGRDDQAMDVAFDAIGNAWVAGWYMETDGTHLFISERDADTGAELWGFTSAEASSLGMSVANSLSMLVVGGTVDGQGWVRAHVFG